MNQQKNIFLLKSFFKRHQLHQVFYNNFINDNNVSWRKHFLMDDLSFDEYCKKFMQGEIRNSYSSLIPFELFFNYAFDWQNSPQEHEWWEDISNKWGYYLRNSKNGY
jgi:hypothetical protein